MRYYSEEKNKKVKQYKEWLDKYHERLYDSINLLEISLEHEDEMEATGYDDVGEFIEDKRNCYDEYMMNCSLRDEEVLEVFPDFGDVLSSLDMFSVMNGHLLVRNEAYDIDIELINYKGEDVEHIKHFELDEQDVHMMWYVNSHEAQGYFSFDDIKVNVQKYNAMDIPYYLDMWLYLGKVADKIIDRGMYNDKEEKLLPLLSFITDFYDDPDVGEEQFIEICSRYHKYKGLNNVKKKHLTLKYLDVWLDIFSMISDSQSEYPHKTEVYKTNKEDYVKEQIDRKVKEEGYIGEYPLYTKELRMKGLKARKSFEKIYLKAFRKYTSYLYFQECYDEDFGIEVVIGNDQHKDSVFFNCFFDDHGKTDTHFLFLDFDRIDDYLDIAFKKSNMEDLEDHEKSLINQEILPGKFYILYGIVLGLIFAVVITVCCIILVFAVVTVLESFHSALAFVMSIKWWCIFLASAVGFGGLSGMCEKYSDDK